LRAIIQILLNGLAILLVARVVPGIHYEGDWIYLLLTGVVFGLLNLTVKPLVTVLSLPVVVLSLGLFFIVINGFILYVASWLLGGLVIALFNWVVRAFDKE
jgi:putative membrane protein